MHWLALDIGGANLKLANGVGFAKSYPFAMWLESQQLAQELRTFIAEAPKSDHLVATMTGELADCFATKAAGVEFILKAIAEAADGRHTRIYTTEGTMVSPQIALKNPLSVAAANWHALAAFAGRYCRDGCGLLLDIGSTTTDIIPLANGKPIARGKTDTERLIHGEMVYTGVERTPVCALVDRLPYREQSAGVAAEWFATTRDVYLILGEFAEDAASTDTADKRPATKAFARSRLARVICADDEAFNHRDAAALAQAAAQAQTQRIAACVKQVAAAMPGVPETVVVSGHGDFLARQVFSLLGLSSRQVWLSEELGPVVARCAPAHALAVLAREAAGL